MVQITAGDMRYAGTEKREAMMAWCRANNIDPNTVDGSHAILIMDDHIQYHEQVRSEKGFQFIDYTGDGDCAATAWRRVPLVEPMPDEWPACSACGR